MVFRKIMEQTIKWWHPVLFHAPLHWGQFVIHVPEAEILSWEIFIKHLLQLGSVLLKGESHQLVKVLHGDRKVKVKLYLSIVKVKGGEL